MRRSAVRAGLVRAGLVRAGVVGATTATVLLGVLGAPPAAAATSTVVLNEIACEGTDWIELANTGSAPADLSGWLLTDKAVADTDATHRYLFPSGTTLVPGARIVVDKGSGGFPFGISCGDDVIRLADPGAAQVNDVSVPDNEADASLTYGRLPDGTGTWAWTTPSKGAANVPAPGGGPTVPSDPAWLYDPLAVNRVDLTISESGINALAAWPTAYVDATMTITPTSGSPVTLDVGVRLKGSTSFRTLDGKAALKIKINHTVAGQRLSGLRGLTLNNMVQDRSMVAEAVTARVFADLGVPAPRVGYAFVRINGAAYGVYSNVETINEDFAASRFASTQHVYEPTVPGTDVAPGSAGLFEVEAGSSSSTADLQALITAAATPASGWLAAASARVDLDEAVRAWAGEHIASHYDSYSAGGPNNYYLHSDGDGVFSSIPSGTDQSWSDNAMPFGRLGRGRLFVSCIADATCRQAYVSALAAALPKVSSSTWSDLAASIATVLAPWQAQDPRKEYTTGDIQAAVALKRAAMAARGAQLATWLGAPTFDGQTTGGGGGAGGGGSGGGSGGGGSAPVSEPITAPVPVAAAVPAAEPVPALVAQPGTSAPAAAAPSAVLVLGPAGATGALVAVRPQLAGRLTSAPTAHVTTGRLVRLRVGPVPTRGALRVEILVDGAWRSLGAATRTSASTAVTRAFRLDRSGTYALRVRSADGIGYLRIQARV